MSDGRPRTTIPPDLLARLTVPAVTIAGARCWTLDEVAAAIDCNRTTLLNWLRTGQMPACIYDKARWWVPESALLILLRHGLGSPGTFSPQRARKYVAKPRAGKRPLADPRRTFDKQPSDNS